MKTKIIFTLLIICWTVAAQQQRMNPQLLRQISSSVFTVYTYGPNGKITNWGSGFVIGPNGLCVTNFHVLENAYSAAVKMKNGDTIKIRNIVDFDPKVDLVKFQLDVPPNRKFLPLKLAGKFPLPGEDVINISTPKSLEQSVSKGNVASVRKHKDHGYIVQVTTPISPGSSGSPVFNMRGDVVGIITSQYSSSVGQNINFAVASRKLLQMTKRRNISLLDMSRDSLETRYIKQAIIALYKRDTRTATEMLNTELRRNPKNYLACDWLGALYYSTGNYKNSSDAYLQSYNISPRPESLAGYADNMATLGIINKGNMTYFKEAYRWYNEVIRLKPDPSVYYRIGSLLYEYVVTYKRLSPKKLQNALEALDYSLSLYNPSKSLIFSFYPSWGYIKRGEIKEAMNDPSGALKDYSSTIERLPTYYKAYYLRGKLRAFHFNEIGSGIEDEETALKLADNVTAKGEILYAQALMYQKLYMDTGNPNNISLAGQKLDEAYRLTQNNAYLTYKYQMNNEVNGEDENEDEGDFF